jgi:hypothetical protein
MQRAIIKPVVSIFSCTILLLGCGENSFGELEACTTSPVQVDGSAFDASEVYLIGMLNEPYCDTQAITHWSSPDAFVDGFSCDFDAERAQIRPSDGRLLYMNRPEDGLQGYDALEGDPATPPCIRRFLVSPTGAMLYTCSDDPTIWYDESATIAYQSTSPDDDLLHLGYGDLALTRRNVVHLSTRTVTPIEGLPTPAIFAARARAPGSFLLMVRGEDDNVQELWEVGADGEAVMRGAYPALPSGVPSAPLTSAKLEPCGALVQIVNSQDVIVRREIGGASAIVYSEENNPTVKMHMSNLVTGP